MKLVSLSVVVTFVLVAGGFAAMSGRASAVPAAERQGRETTATVTRRDFVRSLRLSGTVEAVQSTTIAAPRLSGPNSNSLVITHLIRPGLKVAPGDLLVEFDRQNQLQNAFDRRAELGDLEQQILKKQAEEAAARARDDSEILQAESTRSRAKLEMIKNDMLPRIQVEKNTQALEQAEATLAQLKTTFDLKRSAATADLRILQIRRDKAENAMRQAESNARRMEVRSPIAGLSVIRTTWKSSGMAEIQEGEEARAGMPIVDIVNPAVMRVRSRVNQADINDLRVGQPVRVGLDGYPDLTFTGRIAQISPLAVTSSLSPKVRNFIVLVEVSGSHPNLMPDLTASLDVELARTAGALVVPRDAVAYHDGKPIVRVQKGGSFEARAVTIGTMSAHEALIASGIDEGAVVERNVAGRR